MATKVETFLSWARGVFAHPDLGARGESAAAKELKRRGYEILARRWRCRMGEIDIVARDGETLVVVEVKARTRSDFGAPVNAVNREKRKRLTRLARAYLKAQRLEDVNVRFDAVGVTFLRGKKPQIDVYLNIGDGKPF